MTSHKFYSPKNVIFACIPTSLRTAGHKMPILIWNACTFSEPGISLAIRIKYACCWAACVCVMMYYLQSDRLLNTRKIFRDFSCQTMKRCKSFAKNERSLWYIFHMEISDHLAIGYVTFFTTTKIHHDNISMLRPSFTIHWLSSSISQIYN